jgi:hypothetical protein
MADKMVVYGLRHKRNRLAGEITTLERRNHKNEVKIAALQSRVANNLTKIATFRSQIDVLRDAALVGFASNLPAAISRQIYVKHHFVEWGEVTRATLRLLRTSMASPLTSIEIAIAIDTSHKLNLSDEDLTKLSRTVLSTLKRLRGKGVVKHGRVAASVGEYSSWVLADLVE